MDETFGSDVFPKNFQNGSLIGSDRLNESIPLNEQEDLIVWMRTDALPMFRKLYGFKCMYLCMMQLYGYYNDIKELPPHRLAEICRFFKTTRRMRRRKLVSMHSCQLLRLLGGQAFHI
ncbi:hypothetical protein L1987_16596 [Smallanthus sonchifolius]|uniref:Uncharacterized protein n=1 Tax=Smallanthus sonchifolius TaxID=185202 RepID=A0ACB9IWL1_9ASTR|nr:hypothetical protein L1987_16596 [Smallanthus sonchifolius]